MSSQLAQQSSSPYPYVIVYSREELLALSGSKPTSAQRDRMSYLHEIIPEVIRPAVPPIEVVPPPPRRQQRSVVAKDPPTWRRSSPAPTSTRRSAAGGAMGLVEPRTGNWRSAAWKGTRRRPSAAREPWAVRNALIVGESDWDWEDRLAVEMWRRSVVATSPSPSPSS